MQWTHAVQWIPRTLNLCASQRRSEWCWKLIKRTVIASHTPIFFGSGTALISESSRIAYQRQCCLEGHLWALQALRSLFFKRPALYTLLMVGEQKSIGKSLQLLGFCSCLDSRTNQTQVVLLENKLDLHSAPFVGSCESVTGGVTDWLTGAAL